MYLISGLYLELTVDLCTSVVKDINKKTQRFRQTCHRRPYMKQLMTTQKYAGHISY